VVSRSRESVALRNSSVPACAARRSEITELRRLSVLVILWSMRQWLGNGQLAIPDTPDAMRLAARRPTDCISDVPSSLTVANRRQSLCSCGFRGIFGYFPQGLPKIESEIHISTPSSRYSQFSFPKQKTAILRLWVGVSTNHHHHLYEKIRNSKIKIRKSGNFVSFTKITNLQKIQNSKAFHPSSY
jgi:hypothetical protein